MKPLLRILLAGLVAFLVLAIGQEWAYFAEAWFGGAAADEGLTEAEEREATTAVHDLLVLMRHIYASEGDVRFSERTPASEAILAEIAGDVEYLRRNHRRQDPMLQRFEVVSIRPLDRDSAEIRTKEYWIHRFFFVVTGDESEPPVSQILHGRYLVQRTSVGFRVTAWDSAPRGDATGTSALVSEEAPPPPGRRP